MKIITIKRTHMLPEGTYGTFDIEGKPFCQTVELPWKDNKPDVSCIPKGEYMLKKIISPNFGEVWEVIDVPNRSHVLIHTGNTVKDILGCILIGRAFGVVETKDSGELWGVQESRPIFSRWMATMKNEVEARLVIVEV